MSLSADPAAKTNKLFDLTGKVAVITGGAGLLGRQHAEAIAETGGIPVLVDLTGLNPQKYSDEIHHKFGVDSLALECDVTNPAHVKDILQQTLKRFGRVDILINNAANNPKVEDMKAAAWSRFEQFPLDLWQADLAVGLTGVFLCSQIIGGHLAKNGGGVIVNIASTLGLVGSDQRLYLKENVAPDRQPVKAVSYSAIKGGIISLTRYLATYWATANVRVNSLSPGGVYDGQDAVFVERYAYRTPMGRMAQKQEYKGAIVFLCSEASSYMTGSNLVIDGGLTSW